MTAVPCLHGMPSPACCVECMAEGNLPAPLRERRHVVGPEFRALYPGDCSGCHMAIHEGQLIRLWSDGRYLHTDCRP